MKIRNSCLPIIFLGFAIVVFSQSALAQNWVPIIGKERIRDLVSGSRPEILLREGVIATGEYYPDGTALINAWGETFERTWEVVDDETVCYMSVTTTNCYTVEQNSENPAEFRLTHTETRKVIVAIEKRADPVVFERLGQPDSDGGIGSPSAAEIAAELSNPNTNLGSMNTNFEYITFDGDLPGADSKSGLRATFQPSLPYALSPDTNLFVRPAVPLIIDQDVPGPDGFESESYELGDISFDALIARTFTDIGFVGGVGIVGTLPTATQDNLGRDQWLLGPEAVGAIVRPWGVVGVLVTHQWDVAGEDDFSTSITGGQYFYAFNLQDGWQINASPTFAYDHKADSDNRLTLPVGIGASKTSILSGRPWKFSLQYWHYVESPDAFGPDWQIRFSVSPVVALPW